MKIELDPITGKLVLGFGYKKELVEAIKELADRKYSPEDKTWTVGFDESNLGEILAMLAGNNWPMDMLNTVEAECKQYLGQHQAEQMSEGEFIKAIKPPIMRLGELVVKAYLDGLITQAEQAQMITILNHISLKDFIK